MANTVTHAVTSVLQTIGGVVTGSIIDSVFGGKGIDYEKVDFKSEDVLEVFILLSGQTIVVAGVLVPLLHMVPSKDATGGIFTYVPIFLAMPNYRKRIQFISGVVQCSLGRAWNDLVLDKKRNKGSMNNNNKNL